MIKSGMLESQSRINFDCGPVRFAKRGGSGIQSAYEDQDLLLWIIQFWTRSWPLRSPARHLEVSQHHNFLACSEEKKALFCRPPYKEKEKSTKFRPLSFGPW